MRLGKGRWSSGLTISFGMRFKSPEKRVTREDIKRFAAEFDPQPYHLDEAAAERSVFKGLAASGWHTAAIAMRLAVEMRPFGPHPLLGLGVDELRWLAPVRPTMCSILKARLLNSRRRSRSPKG
jgi:acyl dehydratase